MYYCRGADTSSVATLWEVKRKNLTPNISETVWNFSKRLCQKLGPVGRYKTHPACRDSGSPFGGQVPPTQKSVFAPVSLQKMCCDSPKVFMDRETLPEGILRFKKKFIEDFSRNGGSKFFWGGPLSQISHFRCPWAHGALAVF